MFESARNQRIGLVVVVAVGLAVRVAGLGWGLPFALHPDERTIVEHAVELRGQGWNPEFFAYPSFFIYQVSVLDAAIVGEGGARTLYGMRLLTALYSTATILLVYAIGRCLGGALLGLGSAALYALLGGAVLQAHYGVTDTPMTALATAALWLVLRAWEQRDFRTLLAGSAVAGLAFSTKYTAIALLVPLMMCALWIGRRRGLAPTPRIPASWASAGRVAVVAAIFALSFLLASPFVLLDWQAAAADVRGQMLLQAQSRPGPHVELAEQIGVADRALAGLPLWVTRDFGWPAIAAMLLGFAFAIGAAPQPPGPNRGWWWLASWVLAYFALMAPSPKFGQHYALPLYPALSIFAMYGAQGLADRLARTDWRVSREPRHAEPGERRYPLGLLVAAWGALALWPVLQCIGATRAVVQVDTRLLARQWILENVPAGTTIATPQYGPPIGRADGYRMVRRALLTQQSLNWYCRRDVEYLATSSLEYGRFFDDPERYRRQRRWHRRLERESELVESFGGTELGFNQPTVSLYRLECSGFGSLTEPR